MYATLWKGRVDIAYDRPPMRVGAYVYSDDVDGPQLYRMCYAMEDLLYGEVIKDAPAIVDGGTVTTASAVGANLLVDLDTFTDAESLLIGAFGKTLGTHANGGGQAFYITKKIDDSTLRVFCYSSNTAAGVGSRNTDGNWVVATNTSTTYDLWKHGRVDDASDGIPAVGVCQVNGGVDQSDKPYFFAKCSGIADVLCDDSDNDILSGEWVTVSPTTDGHVEGPNATVNPTNTELSGKIGIALHDEIGFDQTISVALYLPIYPASQHLIGYEHAMNAVTI